MFHVKIVIQILIAIAPIITQGSIRCYKCSVHHEGKHPYDCIQFEEPTKYERICENSTYCVMKIHYHIINGTTRLTIGERGCADQLKKRRFLDSKTRTWVDTQDVLDVYTEGCSLSPNRAQLNGFNTEVCYCKSDLCNNRIPMELTQKYVGKSAGVSRQLHQIFHTLVGLRILSMMWQ